MRLALLVLAVAANVGRAQTFPTGTTEEKNIAYGPHERNKLDVAVPKGDGPFPLLIWIHGGGWEAGDKAGYGVFAGQVARGYAIATINYRYSKQAVFPAQIQDAKEAVRFLRKNAKKYHLDSDRFGVGGGSAGGHLAALLGTSGGVKELEANKDAKPEESRVQAVFDLFGPADLAKLSPAGAKENALTRLLGGDTGVKKELAKAGTPQTYITKDDPPFLILHGDADAVVPVKQSEELHEALKKGGVKSELVIVKGGGHGSGMFTKENAEKVTAFFDEHLKKATRTP